ncbi:MAG: DUF3536 domain-containing protein [Cytophagales bacterium]|nr:DUF3536 domain-containing protein [Cytophagales bacterium]
MERWRSNCGCNSGGNPHWHQHWRAPLRHALDWLRDELAPRYEEAMRHYTADPWAVRDAYIDLILNRTPENIRAFADQHANRQLTDDERIRFLKLLEMQRHAMLMYTSCGWFFDEVSGIETVQILQYASRAIQLADELGTHPGRDLEAEFVHRLADVPSNVGHFGNGATIYEQKVKPARLTTTRLGANYAIVSLFEEYPDHLPLYSHLFRSEIYDRLEAGVQKLAIGMARVTSTLTLEESEVSFAVLYLGQQALVAHAREAMPPDAFAEMHRVVRETFAKGQIGEAIHAMSRYFGTELFSLNQLTKDEQRRVLDRIMGNTLASIENAFRQIYEHNYHMMNPANHSETPVPSMFKTTAEVVVQADLRALFESERPNVEEMRRLTGEVKRWQIKPDADTVGFAAVKRLNALMKQLDNTPSVEQVKYIADWVRELKTLAMPLDLWAAQNVYFFVGNRYYGEIRDLAQRGDHAAQRWIKHFTELGQLLDVRIV